MCQFSGGVQNGLFVLYDRQTGFPGAADGGEIVNQIRSIEEAGQVSNVVFMGMGEPFDNLEEVMKSLDILTAPWGFAMSPRRITVSTIGIIPGMRTFLEKSEAHLAISLHTPFDEERKQLMPVQAVYPISAVMEEVRKWDFSHQRRVSLEYILFRGMNDTPGTSGNCRASWGIEVPDQPDQVPPDSGNTSSGK